MKRRWFAVMGVVVLALDVTFVIRLGRIPEAGGPVALVALAGISFALGGLDPVPDAVPWYRFVGAGDVLFGAVFLVVWVVPALGGDPDLATLVLAVAGVVNALVLGFVGLDWYLGGHHFDLSIYEPGPIWGGSEEEPSG